MALIPADFQERLRDLLATIDAARILLRAERDDTRLERIVSLAVSISGAESGVLLLVDEDRGDLVAAAAVGPAVETLRGARFAPAADVAGMALAGGEPVAVADPGETSLEGEFERRTGLHTRNLLAVPFEVHGVPAGVLELRNSPEPRGFGPRTLEQAAELARLAAAAVEEFRGDRFLLSLFAAALPRALAADGDAARRSLADELRRWVEQLRQAPGYRAAVGLVEIVHELALGGEDGLKLCREILEAVARRERERRSRAGEFR